MSGKKGRSGRPFAIYVEKLLRKQDAVINLPEGIEMIIKKAHIIFIKKDAKNIPGRQVPKKCCLMNNYAEFSSKNGSIASRVVKEYDEKYRLKHHVGGSVCRCLVNGTIADLELLLKKYWS